MRALVLFFRNLLFFSLVLLFSCDKSNDLDIERNLHLRHKGADMPIWVRGNLASNKIVLYLHGGPGDCAMCYRYYFKKLESEVAVAYWDQRIAGASSGKVDLKTLNYEQFGEDAYYVIKLLKEQFPNAEIHLLAHSFGVDLAWQFLTTNDNQKLVNSLIVINGTFSTYRWLYQMREWILREADRQGNADAKDYMLAHPITEESVKTLDLAALYRYMFDLGGNPVSLYDDKKFLLNYAFASPNTALAQFTHPKAYEEYGKTELRRFEKGALLKNIRIPVALFWGTKDGVVPVGVGYETRDLLSNTRTSFVAFEESWHEPFLTETDKFIQAVLEFVR
ncbi:alpha/beta fold hydrolase [Tellurirhabdus bombi]|uniref:alpha/beta fold hydrolase n=1 Tax=Tellurirhabdus bombi TaxID=2907205 RepID=UPI001F370F2E|nr:alpha/beta hydrolase [Tellurirhabdus bombi]